ncbi:MAG: hypothetical protein ACRCY8_20065 [Dermatophilaceae bacterium]
MNRVRQVLPKILPALLLGLVGMVLGPVLLGSLGLSGTAAAVVAILVSVGIPLVGAVFILLRLRRRMRRRAADDAESPSAGTGAAMPRPARTAADGSAIPLDGVWNVTIATPIGAQDGVFDLVVDGSSVTGTADVLGGSVPITDGSVSGDGGRFTITVTSPVTLDLRFHVVATGDALDGTVEAGPMGTREVEGRRA